MPDLKKTANNSTKFSLSMPIGVFLKEYFRFFKKVSSTKTFKINFVLWIVLTVANLIDILVTYYVFAQGGVEANPAMAHLSSKFGNISIAFFKGTLLGILLFLLPFIKEIYQKALMIVCFVYVALVVSHIIRF
jgi:hypothetical protein